MDHSSGTVENITAGLAGRYAKALFDLADEASADGSAIDIVAGDLAGLRAALAESAELAALTSNPMIGRGAAGAAVAAVAAQMGLSPLTTRFLGVLAANRRLAKLGDIAAAFQAILAAHRGEVTAHVTTAHPLAADQLAALSQKLDARAGRSVKIAASVDPAILGGLVITLGSQRIDASIRTRLNNFATAMKG